MNQCRKGNDNIPFLVHPVEVAMILQENNMPEEVVIAGLLHDTLITQRDIEIEFGKKVLELVLGASEKLEGRENTDWKTRKLYTIQYLTKAPLDVKYVSCADKLSNIRSMLRDYEEIEERLWERFNEKNPKEQKWHYESLVESLRELESLKMYTEFENSVTTLFEMVNGTELKKSMSSILKLDNSEIATRQKIKEWLIRGIDEINGTEKAVKNKLTI